MTTEEPKKTPWRVLNGEGGGHYKPSLIEQILEEHFHTQHPAYGGFSADHQGDDAVCLSRQYGDSGKIVVYRKVLPTADIGQLPAELRMDQGINIDRIGDIISAIDGTKPVGWELVGICSASPDVEQGSPQAMSYYLHASDMAFMKFIGGKLKDFSGKPGVFDFANRTPTLNLGIGFEDALKRVLPYLESDPRE